LSTILNTIAIQYCIGIYIENVSQREVKKGASSSSGRNTKERRKSRRAKVTSRMLRFTDLFVVPSEPVG